MARTTMNRLSTEKRAMALNLLVEGSSMSSVSRLLGIDINTVVKLLIDAGETCIDIHDRSVRNVNARYVQVDETWAYIYAKDRNVPHARGAIDAIGSAWTWIAIDAETKLVVSWLVGDRSLEYAYRLMRDLRARVEGRIQISTDGYRGYPAAIEDAFGADADYARQTHVEDEDHRLNGERVSISGQPNMREINSSFIERQNLTMRMSVKRLSRSTNAYSKKLANHIYALALYFTWYNFIRVHSSIETTPAVKAGLTDVPFSFRSLVETMNARIPRQKRGPYRKRIAA